MKSCDTIWVAPILPGGRVRARQAGISWLTLCHPAGPAGWSRFRLEGDRAVWLGPADPWDLEDLPGPRFPALVAEVDGDRVAVLLTGGRRKGDWAVAQRTHFQVGVFDQVNLWHDGFAYWVVGEVRGSNPLRSHNLRLGQAPPRPLERRVDAPPANRLEATLRSVGATLRGATAHPRGWQVDWEYAGRRYQSLIDPEGNLLAAGLCLSGRDQEHDLTTLGSLVRERPGEANGGWS